MNQEKTENTQTVELAKSKADISFEVGFGNDKSRFNLNMISVADEQEIQRQFNDLADSDNDTSVQEFEICKRALIKFSAGDASFIEEKHGTFNVKNERIIRKAYLTFKEKLEPDVVF